MENDIRVIEENSSTKSTNTWELLSEEEQSALMMLKWEDPQAEIEALSLVNGMVDEGKLLTLQAAIRVLGGTKPGSVWSTLDSILLVHRGAIELKASSHPTFIEALIAKGFKRNLPLDNIFNRRKESIREITDATSDIAAHIIPLTWKSGPLLYYLHWDRGNPYASFIKTESFQLNRLLRPFKRLVAAIKHKIEEGPSPWEIIYSMKERGKW